MIHAVILAGGSGTRLWPESRKSRAKQFLTFQAGRSLLETTIRRLDHLGPDLDVRILGGRSMTEQIEAAMPDFPKRNILAEPSARNTAPCIGWAAAKLIRDDPEAVMVVLPADHVVSPESVFCDTLRMAAELVEEDPNRLITLGVKPTEPSTSYGYIQRSEALNSPVAKKYGGLTVPYNVVCFHEKPAREKAAEFLAAGTFAWNAGIFVWKAKTLLELLRRFEPEIGQCLDRIIEAMGTDREDAVTEDQFEKMKRISIDYAVLERAESIVMLEARFAWDDVGTWCSLDRLYPEDHDAAGNLAVGTKILAVDSRNCVVRGNDPKHLFALLGLEDLVVIQTADATLIARKDREESVRDVIEELKKRNWNEYL